MNTLFEFEKADGFDVFYLDYDNMNYESFKIKCEEKGYSPSRLLTELGLSKGNVTKWRNGINPSSDTLIKLSEKLECSVEDLINSQSDNRSDNSAIDEKLSCPFCGCNTVTANLVVKYFHVIEKAPIYRDGVDPNKGNMGGMSEPTLHCSSFHCSSCDKKWYPFQYKLVMNNGECSFKEVRKKGANNG